MKQTISIFKNEDGNAILIAMMVLVLLTIIGTSATRNTTVELQIVRNDIVHREQLYRAESAAMEGSQWLQNAADATLMDLSTTTWINQVDIDHSDLNLNGTEDWNNWNQSAADPGDGGGVIFCGYRIVDETGPVDLGAATFLHTYTVYGLFDRRTGMNRGHALVAIGYKKRF